VNAKPSVYSYLHYRDFLRDAWAYLKEAKGFSNRTFAKAAGIKSPTHLSLIINGKRSLTPKLAKKLCSAFGMKSREIDFFLCLVDFDRSSPSEKEAAYKKIVSYRQFSQGRKLSEETLAYYTRWEHIALLQALGTKLSERGIYSIGNLLGLSKIETDKIASTLQNLGLIQKVNGVWSRTDAIFETPQETANLLIRAFHREMIRKALECVDSIEPTDRKLLSITLPLDRIGLEAFTQRLFESLRSIGSELSNSDSPEGIYQINFQLFPLLTTTSV